MIYVMDTNELHSIQHCKEINFAEVAFYGFILHQSHQIFLFFFSINIDFEGTDWIDLVLLI